MILVWMSRIDDLMGEDNTDSIPDRLCPAHRMELTERLEKGVWRESAAGEMLLQGMLRELGVTVEPEQWHWVRQEFGKPMIPELEPWQFNWSHSNGWVICAVADGAVGVDLQKMTAVRPAVLKHFYTEAERQTVESSAEPDRTFTELWTQREAQAKWSGRGLTREETMEAPFAGTVFVKEFVVTLCSEEPWNGEITIR